MKSPFYSNSKQLITAAIKEFLARVLEVSTISLYELCMGVGWVHDLVYTIDCGLKSSQIGIS